MTAIEKKLGLGFERKEIMPRRRSSTRFKRKIPRRFKASLKILYKPMLLSIDIFADIFKKRRQEGGTS